MPVRFCGVIFRLPPDDPVFRQQAGRAAGPFIPSLLQTILFSASKKVEQLAQLICRKAEPISLPEQFLFVKADTGEYMWPESLLSKYFEDEGPSVNRVIVRRHPGAQQLPKSELEFSQFAGAARLWPLRPVQLRYVAAGRLRSAGIWILDLRLGLQKHFRTIALALRTRGLLYERGGFSLWLLEEGGKMRRIGRDYEVSLSS